MSAMLFLGGGTDGLGGGIGGGTPWQKCARFYFVALRISVSGRRPYNSLLVTSRNHKQPLASRWSAVIARPKAHEFHLVSLAPQPLDPCAEDRSFLRLDNAIFAVQRSPRPEFFHVFKNDDPRPHFLGPPHDHPREIPPLPVSLRLTALSPAEMRAIGTRPKQADRPTIGRLARRNRPDILMVMSRSRMIRRMHRYGDLRKRFSQ